MNLLRLAVILASWIAWGIPFVSATKGGPPQQLDRRARWGMVCQGIGFALVWHGGWWVRASGLRLAAASVFFVLAITLSWVATDTLGRQWRFDAGLNADHQLIRSSSGTMK